MVADALSSASITNLDASPVVANTSGVGAETDAREHDDFVTPTTGGLASTASKYKMIRVSPEIKLKELLLIADAALDSNVSPTLAVDVGAYYSDSTVDGTPVALQGTAISVNCFAANVAFGAATNLKLDVLSSFGQAKRQKRLWDALGLTSNPGGNIDIVVAVHVVAATAVSAALGARALYSK